VKEKTFVRKHALVLTAYKDFEFLKELCEVYSKYFYVYIHIDKKSNISESDMKYLNALDNVSAISRYKINWGSYLHVQAILDLLEMAEQDENDYVHVLSANTILVRHPNELLEFFEIGAIFYITSQKFTPKNSCGIMFNTVQGGL
jgi:hypothetical protein